MGLSTNTPGHCNGVTYFVVGKLVTDGAAATPQTIQLGFVPRYVRVVNLTDRITDEWFEGMAQASSLHTVAAGTMTLETTNGISVSASSFTLTAVTLVASKTFYWEAAA
jgi:hypothetical protein